MRSISKTNQSVVVSARCNDFLLLKLKDFTPNVLHGPYGAYNKAYKVLFIFFPYVFSPIIID
jgi:hypothetical protein